MFQHGFHVFNQKQQILIQSSILFEVGNLWFLKEQKSGLHRDTQGKYGNYSHDLHSRQVVSKWFGHPIGQPQVERDVDIVFLLVFPHRNLQNFTKHLNTTSICLVVEQSQYLWRGWQTKTPSAVRQPVWNDVGSGRSRRLKKAFITGRERSSQI